jgi:mRNA-degrading endonuclease RelE of RelBE toxin-antitoxin system
LSSQFRVIIFPKAARLINRHTGLEARVNGILQYMSVNPYAGSRFAHRKGRFHCRRRWREGDCRLLYDIIEDDWLVEIHDADNRGRIYR